MAVLDSSTYKQVEWHLYHYHELRRQARELGAEREDILHRSRTPATPGGGGVSQRSDPTALKALQMVKLAGQQKYAAHWVGVIERVINRYEGTRKGLLLQMRYLEDLAENYICEKLCIERATYYAWRAEIVTYTALVAVQLGLIRVA